MANDGVPAIDDSSAPIAEPERIWFDRVEPALKLGSGLRTWWQEKTRAWPDDVDRDLLARIIDSDFHLRAFLLTRPSPQWPRDLSYGFVDRASVDGRQIPVIGRFQQTLFDRPMSNLVAPASTAAPRLDDREIRRRWRDNLRAFVLDQALRRGNFENPNLAQPDEQRPLATFLQPFSLLVSPREPGLRKGLLSSQLYYRRADDGRIGKFWPPDRQGIDLDSIRRYRWLVIHLQPQPSELWLRPAGDRMPFMTIPFESGTVGVLQGEDVIDESAGPDSPGGREGYGGRYGVSHCLLGSPWTRRPMAGFEKLVFVVKDDGDIIFQACSVSFHPTWLTARVPDPARWLLDLADRWTLRLASPVLDRIRDSVDLLPGGHSLDLLLQLMDALDCATGGLTARQLGLSRQQLEKRLLIADAIGLMKTAGAVSDVWRSVSGWTSPRPRETSS